MESPPPPPPPSKVSFKLLIDTNAKRVIFAEASKEFIDFLFNLLRLPVGTVTKLLTKEGMVGCFGKLYESIENLSDDYLNNPEQDKNTLLNQSAPLVSAGYLLPTSDDQNVNNNNFGGASALYTCGSFCRSELVFGASPSSCRHVTYAMNTKCPSCRNDMNYDVQLVGNNKSMSGSKDSSGFVKGVVTYTVMDDLEVRPMSSISTMTMISKFKVKDITALQERVVELGMEEGIELLKASLECKNVLTSVFLKNMAA